MVIVKIQQNTSYPILMYVCILIENSIYTFKLIRGVATF